MLARGPTRGRRSLTKGAREVNATRRGTLGSAARAGDSLRRTA